MATRLAMVNKLQYTTVYIGGINRSGGSLLARLFDGHPDVASYPIETGFPFDPSFYQKIESYTGIPVSIPSYDGSANVDVFDLLHIPKIKPGYSTEWGKEHADPIGIRENYLEKAFYDQYETDFDFDKFIQLFNEFRKNVENIAELYDAKHKAYFRAWEGGRYGKDAKVVFMHDSSGFYLTNMEKYFNDFEGSIYIHPIRDIMGYIASEKTRLARRYYGSRRFSYPKFPNVLVKTFRAYDLDAQIRAWMTAVTRAVLFQEKFGVNGRFIIYRNENLLNNTEITMKVFCDKIGVSFQPILLEPSIAHKPWSGNSHQGKQKGVNRDLANYYPKVLAKDEIERINKIAAPVRDFLLEQCLETPVDLSHMPRKILYDYDFQKKYFDDREKSALYGALVNSQRRRVMIKTPDIYAVLAYFYSWYVRILHIPRMIKIKYFPGVGKQNYT